MATTINANNTDGVVITPDTSGELELQANGVTKAKVTANGLQDANGNSLRGGSFRNLLINGDMSIWQRGTSFSGNYTADRWQVAGTSMAITRSTDVPNTDFDYSLSFVGDSNAHIKQKIESANVKHLSGKTITMSFWLKQTVGAGTNAVGIVLYTPNTKDTYGGVTNIAEQSITTTSDWQKYTLTFTNLDSSVTRGLQPLLYFKDSGSRTFLVTGVQIEVGEGASDFEFLPYDVQLARCQRYYSSGAGGGTNKHGYLYSGSLYLGQIYFPTTMRANPVVTVSGGTGTAGSSSIHDFFFTKTGDGNYISNWTADAEL